MAETLLTLADVVKLNDLNARDMGVTDLFNDAPVLRVMAAVPASHGTKHDYLKESAAPTVGFRAVNTGRDNAVAGTTQVSIDLKILDASFSLDKTLADNHVKGAAALLDRYAASNLRQAFFVLERQIFNGSDADGFAGLVAATTIDALADAMVVNAGGTTANTASSVYAICTNAMETEANLVIGNDGMIKIDESAVIQAKDATGKAFPAYFTPISAYAGFAVGSTSSIGRLCNLTEDSGKGCTDARIALLLSKFKGKRPAFLAMSFRSLFQLQASRTATNPTGAPAPIPTESFGVPIVPTNAVLDTESLVA